MHVLFKYVSEKGIRGLMKDISVLGLSGDKGVKIQVKLDIVRVYMCE